jgi:hypothetical protein
MGKDSFFIRADLTVANGAYSEEPISLGSYVDALGKSVLRIHNVQLQFSSNSTPHSPPLYNTGTNATIAWTLTTQSQTAVVRASDRSVISSGMFGTAASQGGGEISHEAVGINLQDWTNGYLVGVEEIYLGGEQQGMVSDSNVAIVIECTVETLSQSAAMALALSQQ